MTFKEGVVVAMLMAMIVAMAMFLMGAEHRRTTLKVYERNIDQFVDVINENKGLDIANYKYKLNSRINCIERECSYKTEYENEGITNTDVIIKLEEDKKTPAKIIYKLNAIKMVKSSDSDNIRGMKDYYKNISKKLADKTDGVYYSTKIDNKLTLDECYTNENCLLIINIKK